MSHTALQDQAEGKKGERKAQSSYKKFDEVQD
jgi:hypothetical protein